MSVDIDNKVKVSPEFFGEKSIIIAKSGYGKSYTSRVIIEEGRKINATFIIIDPQDAYLNLNDFEYIGADNVKSPKQLGILLSQTNRNIVISTKGLTINEQNKFMKEFLTYFRKHIRKGIQTIVIDEAHKYIPEYDKTESKDIVRGMFQENRSDGLGIIGITQRPARIDKTAISQADNMIIGKVTSSTDKKAVENYLDDRDDINKIKNLDKGEFYVDGFNLDEPMIVKIRKSETKHSGESPKNLLNENTELFNNHIPKLLKDKRKRGTKMSDSVDTKKEIVKGIIPSKEGFIDLASIGMKASLGTATAGIVGMYVGRMVPSPLPVISSRTLGSLANTIVCYAGYRYIKQPMVKDVLKYASAGSSAFALGSLTYDVLNALNINMPNVLNFAVSTATGVSPVNVEKAKDKDVEVQPAF